jgi:DNA-binding CsgD family transcriptional regulator
MTRFSASDRELLHLLCLGLPPKAVAAHLGIAVGTANTRIRSLYHRAGVIGATQLLLYVMQQPAALRLGSECRRGLHPFSDIDGCPYCQAMHH